MHNKIYAIPLEVMQGTGEEVSSVSRLNSIELTEVMQMMHLSESSKDERETLNLTLCDLGGTEDYDR